MMQASRRERRPYLREWLTLSLALLVFVALASSRGSLARLDHLVQDLGSRLLAQAAAQDIAVVAMDDRSIAAIGRWPWRRALHAELVNRISAQHPRAIGLDILLGEDDPDYPQDDALLAHAIARSGRVVLPVAQRGQGSTDAADLPLPALRQAARQIGHVQAQVDADGITRGVFEYEGPQPAPWPQFSTALRCAGAQAEPAACRGNALPAAGPWVREELRLLRFARGTPPFPTYAYIDVLKGRVPVDAFLGKYVLVGATATGLGDFFAAPVASGSERIAGVELLAHALHTQLSGLDIRAASAAQATAFNTALVAAALAGLWLLGPLGSLLACALLWLAAIALTLLAPGLWGLQLAPAAALVGILAAYPLWSWRRLSFAAHFLQRELRALRQDGMPAAQDSTPPLLSADRLEQRIHAVESATQQLRDLHRFIAGSLEHLPSPTFVCDQAGRITLANQAAQAFAQQQGSLQHQPLMEVLAPLVRPEGSQPLLSQWPPQPLSQEGRDRQGRRWLMLTNAFAQQTEQHWLVTLVDLTEMRQAQEQRDRALHFISHDLRAPAASILTLLEMQRELPNPMPESELRARIERHARTALEMAQSFMQLASAQTQALRRTPLDLAMLLQEVVQQCWALAQARQVTLTCAALPAQAPCEGDRHLLQRTLTNLLTNAIKFTAPGTEVACSLRPQGALWEIAVRDQGPGIAPERQTELFQPFRRLHGSSHPQIEGVGLGLAFVHEVARRHGGSIQAQSDGLHGSTFVLRLPMA